MLINDWLIEWLDEYSVHVYVCPYVCVCVVCLSVCPCVCLCLCAEWTSYTWRWLSCVLPSTTAASLPSGNMDLCREISSHNTWNFASTSTNTYTERQTQTDRHTDRHPYNNPNICRHLYNSANTINYCSIISVTGHMDLCREDLTSTATQGHISTILADSAFLSGTHHADKTIE